jgi:signal transduction histidine kinase
MSAALRKYNGNLYRGYSWFFKGFLIFGMVAVVALFIYFNQAVVRDIRQDATKISQMYARLIQYGASEASDPEVINFIFDNIISRLNFPIIVTDRNGVPAAWTLDYSLSDTSTATRQRLYALIRQFDSQNPPIEIRSDTALISVLHYGNSDLIWKLRVIPIIEILVIGVFVLVAYIGFRNIKRSEQRSIWVGMAKETAHQLGTPLSSLIGWVELLRMRHQEGMIILSPDFQNGDFTEMTDRMLNDLRHLDRIATRFGQIGSTPELSEHDINDMVKDVVDYLRQRLPAGGAILEESYGELPCIRVNAELLRWVVENLIKNSMEAADPKTGKIQVATSFNAAQKRVIITVEDNGRGIVFADQKKVFSPGYTTKKRGWGLGLSLAKRIVEEYHGGRISLKSSEPNVKTIFAVELPV